MIRIPSAIDIHVHVREPGHEYKETYMTAMKSAISGGITTICAMPNTDPSLKTEDDYNLVNNIAKKANKITGCKYFLYQIATNDINIDPLKHENICGLKMYLNCTTGNMLLKNRRIIEHYFKCGTYKIIMCHAEIDILPMILHFSDKYKQRTHICHVARKSEIELIKKSKLTNNKLTCEVAPHHLILKKSESMDKIYAVKPELQSDEDIKALWNNMNIIDCIATDHAPHLYSEKTKKITYGYPGLETMLPLMFMQVKLGKLTLDELIDKIHYGPKRVLDLPKKYGENDYLILKSHPKEAETTLYKKNKYTKADWSPFENIQIVDIINDVFINNEKIIF